METPRCSCSGLFRWRRAGTPSRFGAAHLPAWHGGFPRRRPHTGVHSRNRLSLRPEDPRSDGSTCRCIHRRVLEALDFDRIKSNGYSFQVELHYRTWKQGFDIKEVPIIFTERTEGTSKMNNSIIREAALKVWELRFRTLFGRL